MTWPPSLATERGRSRAALLVVLAIQVGVLGLWISRAELPAGCRDEFVVLEESIELALGRGTMASDELRAILLHSHYPPLTHLPGILGTASGGGYRTLLALHALMWLPLLVGAVLVSARRFTGEVGAVASLGLVLAYPAVVESTHRLESNLGSLACTAAAIAAWLACDHLRDRRATAWMGVFVGLGLLSERLGVLPLVAGPIAWSLLQTRDRRSLGGVAMVAGIAALLAGWWYAFFLPNTLAEFGPQLLGGEVGARGQLEEIRPPLLLDALHYLVLWPDSQLGLLGGLAGLVAVAAVGVRKEERRATAELLVFLGAGLLLFSLVRKRQAFYSIPLLWAVAILTVRTAQRGLAALPRPGLRAGIGAGAILLAALPSLTRVGDEPPHPESGLLRWAVVNSSALPEAWIGERYPTGGPPDAPGLGVPGLLDRLAAAGVEDDRPIAVWSDDGMVSESQLVSLLRLERGTLDADGITIDREWFEEQRDRISVLLLARPRLSSCALPTSAEVVALFERRQGWGDQPTLLETVAALGERLVLFEDREVGHDSRLCVWVLSAGGGRAGP